MENQTKNKFYGYYMNLELRNSQNLQNGVKWPYIEELTILHHYENRNSVIRQSKAGCKILLQTIKT